MRGEEGVTDGTSHDNLVNEDDSGEGEQRRVGECEGGELKKKKYEEM